MTLNKQEINAFPHKTIISPIFEIISKISSFSILISLF
jgi:hypothetical protein